MTYCQLPGMIWQVVLIYFLYFLPSWILLGPLLLAAYNSSMVQSNSILFACAEGYVFFDENRFVTSI